MRLSSFTWAAATLAAVGHGFLIPLDVLPTDAPGPLDVSPADIALATDRTLLLACHDCPVRGTDLLGNPLDINQPSKLVFNLAVDKHDGRPDALVLNNVPIWPPSPAWSHQRLVFPQHVEMTPQSWSWAAEPRVVYRLAYEGVTQNDLELLFITLEIFEVAGRAVPAVANLQMRVLKDPNGSLWIQDLFTDSPAITPGPVPVPAPHSAPKPQQPCKGLLCAWRETLRSGMRKMNCAGHRAAGTGAAPAQSPPASIWAHPHGSHGRHASLLRTFTFQILVPATLGVLAGVLASVLGMLVGHLIIFVYRMVYHRHCHSSPRYEELRSEDAEYGCDDVLIIYAEGPPAYEDSKGDEKMEVVAEVTETQRE